MKTFSARETVWLQELDGIELAGFWRRAIALTLDIVFAGVAVVLIVTVVAFGYLGVRKMEGLPLHVSGLNSHLAVFGDKAEIHGEPENAKLMEDGSHFFTGIVVPVLYFGLFLWQGNGRTPGKRLMKIRVVSLVHTHMSFWHSVERALGYGAAALEGGFGFIQYFIHPYRRCAQDRLAETIVVTERSYQEKFPKVLGVPSEEDTQLA